MQLTHASIEQHAQEPLSWALLTLLLNVDSGPAGQTDDVRNAEHKAQLLAEARTDQPPSQPFLNLEILLLDMRLGCLVMDVHAFSTKQPHAATARRDLALCLAQAYGLSGDTEKAKAVVNTIVDEAGAQQHLRRELHHNCINSTPETRASVLVVTSFGGSLDGDNDLPELQHQAVMTGSGRLFSLVTFLERPE
jgi:hypothetical protein